ncbi:hypothetical protein Btru_042647 [Bulinus truncatus]|nr:hypothetical protein Btru_042647 [Bulinus truncatus]
MSNAALVSGTRQKLRSCQAHGTHSFDVTDMSNAAVKSRNSRSLIYHKITQTATNQVIYSVTSLIKNTI